MPVNKVSNTWRESPLQFHSTQWPLLGWHMILYVKTKVYILYTLYTMYYTYTLN